MRRLHWTWAAGTVLLCALPGVGLAQRAMPVPNPGFEEVAAGQPVGWQAPAGSVFSWSVTTDEAHSGERALAVRLATHAPGEARLMLRSDRFAVEGGRFYRLSGWVTSRNWQRFNPYARLHVSFLREDGTGTAAAGARGYGEIGQVDPWGAFELQVPAPDDARFASLLLEVTAPDPTQLKDDLLLVDDLRMTAYDPPADPPAAARRRTYVPRVATAGAVVDDPDSRAQKVQVFKAGRDAGYDLAVFGAGVVGYPPGFYRATWRLKVADNTPEATACYVRAIPTGFANPHSVVGRTVPANAFARPNEYQEISFDFFRPPMGGVAFTCWWPGAVDLWLDTLSLTCLQQLSDRELRDSFPASDESPVRPDPQGALYVARGLHYPLWRLEQTAELLGAQVGQVSTLIADAEGEHLNPPFPATPAELAGLRAVVLADVGAAALEYAGRDALERFVAAGGALLVLGGWDGLRPADLSKTFLEDMLPVTAPQTFTLKQCADPAPLTPAPDWAEAATLPWRETPSCLWIRQVSAKPGCRLLVSAGRSPFLVRGSYGRGHVIACTGTVLGQPPQGSLPFWEWTSWPALLARAVGGYR